MLQNKNFAHILGRNSKVELEINLAGLDENFTKETSAPSSWRDPNLFLQTMKRDCYLMKNILVRK